MLRCLAHRGPWKAPSSTLRRAAPPLHQQRSPLLLRHCRVFSGASSGGGRMAEEMPGIKRARSVQTEITLTPEEVAVFKVFSDAKDVAGAQTVIRVVGGWVRDKVLGMESDDIDIALDDMTGADFAECVLAHLNAQGIETSKLAVIERNPEQSKHLETATMKVEGVSVDFVGLRAEEYAAGSRIPEVRLGTADEDALRRDLTINALFYRVDTGQVEDLTGRGLAGKPAGYTPLSLSLCLSLSLSCSLYVACSALPSEPATRSQLIPAGLVCVADLRAGVARTPLEPMQTFTDDPLRVLRAIRFATRFDLRVDGALAAAAASDSVRDALDTKVSRERLAVEVSKMMDGADPIRAVYLLASLSLWDVVFGMPDEELIHRQDWVGNAAITSVATLPAEGVGPAGLHCMLLAHRLSRPTMPTAALLPQAPLKLSLLWWASLFLPCRHQSKNSSNPRHNLISEGVSDRLRVITVTKFKKAGTQTVVEYMHRESLKGLSLGDAKSIDVIINSAEALRVAVTAHAEGKELDRVAVGLRVRELKDLHKLALLVACAAELYDELGPALIAAETARGAWTEPVAGADEAEAEPAPAGGDVGAVETADAARETRLGALTEADGESTSNPSPQLDFLGHALIY